MPTITIDIQRRNHRYDIVVEPGIAQDWRAEVAKRIPAASYLAVMDEAVAAAYGYPDTGAADGAWRFIRMTPGEAEKNLAQYVWLCEQALGFGIDRKTVLVAVGGGITGDVAGFAAATLLRGIRFVQVPTTLLAQVDSSVGGKTGVNACAGKNLVGSFHQPDLVLVDPAFLDTLPVREYRAGLAEVVKTAVLDGPVFFHQLLDSAPRLKRPSHRLLAGFIARCCAFKGTVVAHDETEKGRRALLNLGHTFGHALEALGGYDGRIVHGEAVAVGMVLAAKYAAAKGYLPDNAAREIAGILAVLDLPTRIAHLGGGMDWQTLLAGQKLEAALAQDKKGDNRTLTLVLPHAIGDCRVETQQDIGEVAAFMRARG